MALWKTIMLVAFPILILGLIACCFIFRVFLNDNSEKMVEEVYSQVIGYLYWFLAIEILTMLLLIVGVIFKYTL